MPARLPGRSYTTYDVYNDYGTEELLNDMYQQDGAYSPQPYGDDYSAHEDRMTPLNGMQNNGQASPGRPRSKLGTPGRSKSRLDVSVQTEKKRRPLVSETQRNYAIPNQDVRPTSPVQRLLNRWHTQPAMSLQGPIPGSSMDPITRQYYHRMWKNQTPSTDISLNRQGRAGGVWRHVRACVANTGTQLAFIDGTVKEEDNVYFSPYSGTTRVNPPPSYADFSYMKTQTLPRQRSAGPRKYTSFQNKYADHAKRGFKYWYQEPKPIDLTYSWNPRQ